MSTQYIPKPGMRTRLLAAIHAAYVGLAKGTEKVIERLNDDLDKAHAALERRLDAADTALHEFKALRRSELEQALDDASEAKDSRLNDLNRRRQEITGLETQARAHHAEVHRQVNAEIDSLYSKEHA